MTSGLFRRVVREIGAEYPGVVIDDFHMDAITVHLLRRADTFDVIVAENMFGDILSDLAGEIAGSLGTAPSINASETRAMAQATHGSAPDIAGTGRANPLAMILSAGMLLDWMSVRHDDARLARAGARVERAAAAAIEDGVVTPDLGGTASTREVTDRVLSESEHGA
jgi:3-isopropylmalate dehydrogenase